MTVYLFTLGFHPDHITRKLFRAENVEAIYIVTAKPVVKAVQDAYKDVVGLCEKTGLPPPKLIDIDVLDPGAAVYTLVRELKRYRSIYADLSGGMRIVVVITMIALFILSKDLEITITVAGEREDRPEISIDGRIFAYLSTSLSDERKRILEMIAKNPGIDITYLSQILGRSERTIRIHVSELKKMGLIDIKSSGAIHPTSWAWLFIES